MLGVGGRLRRPTVIRGYRMASTVGVHRIGTEVYDDVKRKAARTVRIGRTGTFQLAITISDWKLYSHKLAVAPSPLMIDGCLLRYSEYIHSFIHHHNDDNPMSITLHISGACAHARAWTSRRSGRTKTRRYRHDTASPVHNINSNNNNNNEITIHTSTDDGTTKASGSHTSSDCCVTEC